MFKKVKKIQPSYIYFNMIGKGANSKNKSVKYISVIFLNNSRLLMLIIL